MRRRLGYHSGQTCRHVGARASRFGTAVSLSVQAPVRPSVGIYLPWEIVDMILCLRGIRAALALRGFSETRGIQGPTWEYQGHGDGICDCRTSRGAGVSQERGPYEDPKSHRLTRRLSCSPAAESAFVKILLGIMNSTTGDFLTSLCISASKRLLYE